QITGALQSAEEILDDTALGDNDNYRLQFAGRVRHRFKTPDDLVDWKWRDFFQLQFDHRAHLVRFALRKVNDTQKNLLGRQPGDVQFFLPQGTPILDDHARGQGSGRDKTLFRVQGDLAVAGRKLPEPPDLGAGLKDVARMPAGRLHVRLPPVLSCVPRSA